MNNNHNDDGDMELKRENRIATTTTSTTTSAAGSVGFLPKMIYYIRSCSSRRKPSRSFLQADEHLPKHASVQNFYTFHESCALLLEMLERKLFKKA